MNFQTIELRHEGAVAVITLNRAPVNAISGQMIEEVTRAFDMLNDSKAVRCVVLTGQGKLFCAGADLKDRPPTGPGHEGAYWKYGRSVRECFNVIQECSKPVIAAVNGPAIGAGFALMSSCDIWVASNTAYVAMTEINVGLAGGTTQLQAVFGKSRARRMFFTGCQVSADELYRLGLIEASLPPEELMPYTMQLAQEIAAKAPLALRHAKQAAQVTALLPARDAYRFEQNITSALAQSEDALEARQAFIEKRTPVFKGN
ncbi:enoyl-CoA hydratase/isomerase family protein [Hydrogenophaga sp.]|uniref:enoyl-CoA hydratase/isomerase family protein n=1 Tax=Hydrogenophaga sp. TaxID=1904254 RepID=UPI00271ED9B5|nr:enoyl-CoA hydratase/isomerase family protein [Hydrogenophaga sp.]MDO9435981.1 enoyl-CoA hydratase/isomerase family protein [Hydrogenophaga sp.]